MNIFHNVYNVYEIEQARRQYMLEVNARQHLADSARAGRAQPGRIVRIVNAFQRVMSRRAASGQQIFPINEVIPSTTNG